MIRVLIAEDSPTALEFLLYILGTDPEILVTGTAKNGQEVLEFLETQMPDVVVMDMNMPKMDGFEATTRIMETKPLPIIIVTASHDKKRVDLSFRATEAGALALLDKPKGPEHPDYARCALELIQTVKAMSEVKVVRRWSRLRQQRSGGQTPVELKISPSTAKIKLVVMGASTGGPLVLQTILASLPKNFPAPLLIVQHIAPGFLVGLKDWLCESTGFPVSIARHGEMLLAGCAYLAPDGVQVGVTGDARVILKDQEPINGLCPSISFLFQSAANSFGPNALGVLLTGMGKDGAEELKLMQQQGAITIAQDEESSIIHGMPGEAIKIGAATHVLSASMIGPMLAKLLAESN